MTRATVTLGRTTRRPRRLVRTAALAAAAALLLAGCATDVPPASGPSGAPSAPSDEVTLSVPTSGPWEGRVIGSAENAPTVDGDQVTIDVGAAAPITVEKDKKLRIGFSFSGSCTGFYQIAWAWAQAAAEEYGYEAELLENCFDLDLQISQLQQAINDGKYDAIVGTTVDGSTECDLWTKELPAANILVVPMSNPVCGLDAEPVTAMYSPGTLAYVGGATGTTASWQAFLEVAYGDHAGEKGLSINYPVGICGCATSYGLAVENALEATGNEVDLTISEVKGTDAAAGQALAQQYLNDNPDAGFINVLSWETGQGVVEAVKSAGLEDQVDVYISGADPGLVDAIVAGDVTATNPNYPGHSAWAAVQLLHQIVSGETIPTIVANDGAKLESFSDTEPPFGTFIDQTTVEDFEPDTVDSASARG
ncbi:substrate-binding domain-containing protein [Microbacterium sp. LWH7-1.2]